MSGEGGGSVRGGDDGIVTIVKQEQGLRWQQHWDQW